ncbi:MAG TPA: tRNA lysidine(34) synthetase TilS [Tepidiformaceae bacterium]|nr:tRNA lysidine(34) synthetase TilS [Tepidiformaceae bacterium]
MVALSGGPDSLACLLVLLELREAYGFEVIAAHFNHMTRPGSARDLERVRELCRAMGVEISTGEGDVPAVARQQKRGVEDAGRMMRYQFMGFVAGKEGAGAIATGHTADDQVETVAMRFLRGTGVRGLRGMLPSSPLPGAAAQKLVRPLLELRRIDTVAICDAAGIEPIVDESNMDTRFTRNRLRNETLPLLRQANPALDTALLGLAANAREAFAPIERQSMAVQPKERVPVGAVFALAALRELQTEALLLVIEREMTFFKMVPEVNRTRLLNLRRALETGAGEVQFGPAIVEVSCGQVRVGPATEPAPTFEPVILNVPGVTRAGDVIVTAATDPLTAGIGEWTGSVDMTSLRGALRIRPVAHGDRLVVAAGTRALQDYLVNSKTPRWVRREMLAISDGQGVRALPFGPRLPMPPPVDDVALYLKVALAPRDERPEPGGSL